MSSAIQQAKNYAKYNNDLMMQNTRQSQAYNAAEAAKNRDWQERLANSAHQREVADLKKAGLNPVLSAGGQGATTGSGASASSDAAGVDTSMVGAVIDMASAQLNSATQLQTTAMQVAASIENNIRDNETSWKKHITTSGETISGQISNAGGLVDRLFDSLTSSSALGWLFGKGKYKNNQERSKATNDKLKQYGLAGYALGTFGEKADKKTGKRYAQFKERGKPKYATNKAYSIKNTGIGAIYRNTVADKYNSSKSFRKKYDKRNRAMNVHYKKTY
uniref:DNA pilot protein n=1 Tax=Dulem virus 193 TaxID=3145670 RepID=A0AAU8AYF2_9VIRU